MSIHVKSVDETQRRILCGRINKNLFEFNNEHGELTGQIPVLSRNLENLSEELVQQNRELALARNNARNANLLNLIPGAGGAGKLLRDGVGAVAGIASARRAHELEGTVARLENRKRKLERELERAKRRENELQRLISESRQAHVKYQCDIGFYRQKSSSL